MLKRLEPDLGTGAFILLRVKAQRARLVLERLNVGIRNLQIIAWISIQYLEYL